jgi:hypothetical protein
MRLVALALPLVLVSLGCARPAPEPDTDARPAPRVERDAPLITTTVERAVAPMPPEQGERDLTNEDIGLDPKIEAALPEIERPDRVVVEAPLTEPFGQPDLTDPKPDAPKGTGPFAGRTGATKDKLLKMNGGNAESERAVALGLAWLAKQQKADGSWEFDQGQKEQKTCATGLTLMAFLGAGQTHTDPKGKYQKTVADGIAYLVKVMPANGANAGRFSTEAYSNAIAALGLIEAYAITKDAKLKAPAQAAINYIQKSQGPNGSWGYSASSNGDTSIVGWQVQALYAAKHGGLVVDDKVIAKAVKFLDFSAKGEKKSMYGYTDSAGAAPGTGLTAVGLLCRSSIDAWGPAHPGMADGVAGLMKNPPAGTGAVKNLYYYYYATQVLSRYDGEEWKSWNEGPKNPDGTRKGGMRDWLVGAQIKKADDPKQGSWDPETGWFGSSCGRLGTTAVCVLNLEVYYRYLPTMKRER